MEEHRRRNDQPAGLVQDHAGEIARLADDGGIARTIEMIVHLVGEARDLVAQDLNGDRVDHARLFSTTRLRKGSTCAVKPVGMTVVASNCSTIAGPVMATPMSNASRS